MKKILSGAALSVGLALAASPTLAIPFHGGSFGYNTSTTTTTAVDTTTSFVLSPADMHSLGSGIEDFSAYVFPASLAITTPLIFNNANVGTFDWTNAALGSFAGSTVSLSGSGATFAAWEVKGTFTTGTSWDNPGQAFDAVENWSLSQSGGAGHTISMSGTFNVVATPEPATLALFGAGLAGLGMRRRRKSA